VKSVGLSGNEASLCAPHGVTQVNGASESLERSMGRRRTRAPSRLTLRQRREGSGISTLALAIDFYILLPFLHSLTSFEWTLPKYEDFFFSLLSSFRLFFLLSLSISFLSLLSFFWPSSNEKKEKEIGIG
jgi:pilus assembly protein TadC